MIGITVTSQAAPESSMIQLRPNQKLMRSARLARLVLMGMLFALAVVESDPVGRGLAVFAAFWFGASALLVPRARTLFVVATESGLESRFFGLLSWDEIAAVRVRQRRRGRALEIYDRNRTETIRRTRPRLLQLWMLLSRPLRLPLLRISERMASFDAVEFRSELERLAHRTFPER
jgi:hypothetical protein